VFNLPAGPDQVLDQDPDAGSTVPKGTRVNLSAF
jgi:beta-lactam-binding protein with PASTA domain